MDQQTIKTFDRAARKLRFYLQWHSEMKGEEHWLATWVIGRIVIFSAIIKEIEAQVARTTGPNVGNYGEIK